MQVFSLDKTIFPPFYHFFSQQFLDFVLLSLDVCIAIYDYFSSAFLTPQIQTFANILAWTLKILF